MIVTTLVTFYEQNHEKISNLNRQQRTCVSRTKCTHTHMLDYIQKINLGIVPDGLLNIICHFYH